MLKSFKKMNLVFFTNIQINFKNASLLFCFTVKVCQLILNLLKNNSFNYVNIFCFQSKIELPFSDCHLM